MVVGSLAFVGAALGVVQKWRNDHRERWWDRTEWALDKVTGSEAERTVGLLVLTDQIRSKLASGDDAKMLQDVSALVLEEVEPEDE